MLSWGLHFVIHNRVIAWGGGGGEGNNSYDGLYRDAVPERGTLFQFRGI